MDMTTLIGVISLLILGVASTSLALWCKYDDGVIGHIALALMSLCALVVGMEAFDETEYQLLPTTSAMFAAMACFMVRHAYRAWRFSNGR
jgi:EamA domain-containing membrane protein RarD